MYSKDDDMVRRLVHERPYRSEVCLFRGKSDAQEIKKIKKSKNQKSVRAHNL